MKSSSVRLRLRWSDGTTRVTTLAAFCADNADHRWLCTKAKTLRVGERFRTGGGAAPVVTVSRIRARAPR